MNKILKMLKAYEWRQVGRAGNWALYAGYGRRGKFTFAFNEDAPPSLIRINGAKVPYTVLERLDAAEQELDNALASYYAVIFQGSPRNQE